MRLRETHAIIFYKYHLETFFSVTFIGKKPFRVGVERGGGEREYIDIGGWKNRGWWGGVRGTFAGLFWVG